MVVVVVVAVRSRGSSFYDDRDVGSSVRIGKWKKSTRVDSMVCKSRLLDLPILQT